MKTFLVILLGLFASMLFSCSHTFTMVDEDDSYASIPTLDKEITINVVGSRSKESEVLISEIVSSMRKMRNIKVNFPPTNSDENSDYRVDLNIVTEYSGAGSNFFVSFPGFLIFASAWNGYYYNVDVSTKADITNLKTNRNMGSFNYDNDYHCKHAEFDRTWTGGLDWLLTWGAASLIGGIVYTGFDDDIKTKFRRHYSVAYGEYIGRKIVSEMQ